MKEINPRRIVTNGALISSKDWREGVYQLSSFTNNPDDKELLDGIIIEGYETKFADGTNTNGERFEPGCLDKFIHEYYVEKGLNMPLVVEHSFDPEWIAGRIVYAEVNEVGFKYVAYIPKTYMHYAHVKNLLANGIIQGFSKFGWCNQGQWIEDPEDKFGGYFLVQQMDIINMAIVTTPANGLRFDEVGEIMNAMRFENKTKKAKVKNGFAAMFNQ